MTDILEDTSLKSCPHRCAGLDDWPVCSLGQVSDKDITSAPCFFDGTNQANYAECSTFKEYLQSIKKNLFGNSLDSALL